jgi:hypothetical protein
MAVKNKVKVKDANTKPQWRAEHIHTLHEMIAKAYEDAWQFEKDYPDNLNNRYFREHSRLIKMATLIENFFEFDIYDHGGGCVIIKNKYIVSLSSKKYRIKGKGTWYSYKKIQQLFDIMNEKTS